MDILYVNIKRLRKEAKMSQEELAKRVGYTDRSSIAKIENGEVDLSQSKIKAFADVFNVTPQYLMGYESNQDNARMTLPDFKTAQDAIKFILSVPLVAQYGGYSLDEMSDEELIDFANRVAQMIQIMRRND
jgi:transcriptional regulator with XRE-family HTH domain